MQRLPRLSFAFSIVLLPWMVACGSGSTTTSPGFASGGANGSAGASGEGGAPSGSELKGALPGAPSAVSGLPDVGEAGVAQPSGTEANLKVLNWAGFDGAASYTFDDSQPSQIEHWPELKSTGVRMTWYVNPTGNWFSGFNAMLEEAASLGHELGNHTMSHCRSDLSGCAGQPPLKPVGTAEEEVDQCTDYITQNLGQSEVWSIAYPYGDTSWSTISKERFLLGRGVGSGMLQPLQTAPRYNLPTYAVKANDSSSEFNATLDSARSSGAWTILLFHSLTPSTYNWYAGADAAEVVKSIEYAQTSGGLWLDSLVSIGSYWLAQEILTNTSATQSADGLSWTWSLPEHFPKGQYLRVTVDGGRLSQNGKELPWDAHGYYEVALDAGSLDWSPLP